MAAVTEVHITNGIPDSGTGEVKTIDALITALGSPIQTTGGTVTANAGTNLNTSALGTSAKQDTIITALGTLGTQTTSAAILAKIIAAPATEAKQDTGNTSLASILTTAGATNGAAVITDANGTLQQYARGNIVLALATNTKLDTVIADIVASTLPVGAGTVAAAGRVTLGSDDPAVTALQIMDDWDETNRAAVNVIAGQVGVAAGSGSNSALTQRVTVATDDTMMASIRSPGLTASVSQTRPSNTNTYGAGDVLGPTGGGTASMNFALGAVSGSNIMITSVSLERDVAALISGETSYILHLYNVTQPAAQADEATFTLAAGDRSVYLGNINLGTPVDLVDTLYVEQNGVNKQVKLAGTGIFGVLVTVTGYVAASASVLKVTINAVQL